VKIKKAIEVDGGPFILFGGEPLLLPLRDLEDLWSWGYEKYGRNHLQTNGTLISEQHIELFHKYRVNVGLSMDGPGELNDARWHGSIERTRESTARSEAAIRRLCNASIIPSLIITLHRQNATALRLPVLIDWVRQLTALGLRTFRLHVLESESLEIRDKFALSIEENLAALAAFWNLSREIPEVHFDLIDDMQNLLLGTDSKVTCIWAGCDPYTTEAVRGIEGKGQRSNCGRTNKDGIDFVKADHPGHERYIALYHTPQEASGCRGCRFFLMCKGQCPGTAVDGDWRNRTEHCSFWKAAFEILEQDLVQQGKTPISLDPRRGALERLAIEEWSKLRGVSISRLLTLLPTAGDATIVANDMR